MASTHFRKLNAHCDYFACVLLNIFINPTNISSFFFPQNANRFAQQIERALTDMKNLFVDWKMLNKKMQNNENIKNK